MKCIFSGCKCQSTVKVQQNWGKPNIVGFCEEHKPEWVKEGKKESPKVSSFGQPAKSYYALIEA